MTTLTPDQARRLAEMYLELSSAVLDYQIEHQETLTETEKSELTRLDMALRDSSRVLSGLAGRLALDELGPTLASIEAATGNMKQAIAKIQSAAKAIQVVAKAVALGGALASLNPRAIAGSVQDLLSASATGAGRG